MSAEDKGKQASGDSSAILLSRWFKELSRFRFYLYTAVVAVLISYVTIINFSLIPTDTEIPACKNIEGGKSKGIIFTHPEKAKAKPGLFCSCLSEAARRTSSNWLIVAVIVGLLGASFVLLGGALGPPEGAKPGTLPGERGIILAGLGALLISLSVYANSRATAASETSAKAHTALALDQNNMYNVCIDAKSEWISSRVESAASLLNRVSGEKPPGEGEDSNNDK